MFNSLDTTDFFVSITVIISYARSLLTQYSYVSPQLCMSCSLVDRVLRRLLIVVGRWLSHVRVSVVQRSVRRIEVRWMRSGSWRLLVVGGVRIRVGEASHGGGGQFYIGLSTTENRISWSSVLTSRTFSKHKYGPAFVHKKKQEESTWLIGFQRQIQ